MYTYTYAYMHICIFVYKYICISYICKCIHICIYVYVYMHMYTHIRIPTGRDHLPSALVRSPFGPRALSSPRLQRCHIITECHITSSRALSSPRLQRCHIITECHITSSHSLISHHHMAKETKIAELDALVLSSSTNTVDITSSYLNICATSHHHMAKETKIAELNTVVLEHKHVTSSQSVISHHHIVSYHIIIWQKRPRSPSLTLLSSSTNTFSGFRSRCTILRSCRYATWFRL